MQFHVLRAVGSYFGIGLGNGPGIVAERHKRVAQVASQIVVDNARRIVTFNGIDHYYRLSHGERGVCNGLVGRTVVVFHRSKLPHAAVAVIRFVVKVHREFLSAGSRVHVPTLGSAVTGNRVVVVAISQLTVSTRGEYKVVVFLAVVVSPARRIVVGRRIRVDRTFGLRFAHQGIHALVGRVFLQAPPLVVVVGSFFGSLRVGPKHTHLGTIVGDEA